MTTTVTIKHGGPAEKVVRVRLYSATPHGRPRTNTDPYQNFVLGPGEETTQNIHDTNCVVVTEEKMDTGQQAKPKAAKK